MTQEKATSVRMLIALLTMVQFIHIVDFMMVIPLSPDFAASLGFPENKIGIISGSYTFAAAIAGFVFALFLDMYSRKRALLFCLTGLLVATAAAAFVTTYHQMIAARLLAGMLGGPMFGISGAFISDYVPPKERGVAMGKLMGGFSLASVLGVPFGLYLAGRFSWQAPFLVLAGLGAIVLAVGLIKLPYHAPLVDPEAVFKKRLRTIIRMLSSRLVWASYGCSAVAMLAGFMIIPTMPAYMIMNHGYPREHLDMLYMVGGAITFFTQRFAGYLVDKTTATITSIIFGIVFIINIWQGFILEALAVPVVVTFVIFMISMSGRGVASQTLGSKVPPPSQRGAFMVVQGSIINISTSIGAYYSSQVLEVEDGRFIHMDMLATETIALSLAVPLLFWYVEKKIKGHQH